MSNHASQDARNESTPRDLLERRRQQFAAAMKDGVALVVSATRTQDELLEFCVPESDNHDFTYLTGLEGESSRDSALMLCPAGAPFEEILYTSGDPDRIKQVTGIADVLPQKQLLDDLSDGLTDYSLLRSHQRGSKPRSTAISRSLGREKIIYFNYPRFVNLSEPPPRRLALADRLRQFSPKVQLRDACDILNRLRMVHDKHEIAILRRAADIVVEVFVESIQSLRDGMSTAHLAAAIDCAFACRNARPSFPTNVGNWALGSGVQGPQIVRDGDVISYDMGAEYKGLCSDFGRTVPVSGFYSDRQREVYDAMVGIQKRLIEAVRPGETLQGVQALKNRLVAEAGFAEHAVGWGLSHFVGMDVHDVGDNAEPFHPGTCFVIEWRLELEGMRFRFEDVVLVTEHGHEWLTGSAPIETSDIEAVMKAERLASAVAAFV